MLIFTLMKSSVLFIFIYEIFIQNLHLLQLLTLQNTGWHNRRYQRQASEQKSCFFNLETKSELLWEDWDLGGEFTKLLVIKNIYNKSQKMHLRYNFPNSLLLPNFSFDSQDNNPCSFLTDLQYPSFSLAQFLR